MKIFIDPGHGGGDPGAVGPSGLTESSVNLDVALRLGNLLNESRQTVKYSKTTNISMSLAERARLANEWNANYFVSIHCNSAENPTANGTETFCYRTGITAEQLAKSVQNNLIAQIGLRDRGVKTANFAVLRLTTMPAILVELAFISNPEEERLLDSNKFRQNCAIGIANGIMAFI